MSFSMLCVILVCMNYVTCHFGMYEQGCNCREQSCDHEQSCSYEISMLICVMKFQCLYTNSCNVMLNFAQH